MELDLKLRFLSQKYDYDFWVIKTPIKIIIPPTTKKVVSEVPKNIMDRIVVITGCKLLKTATLLDSIFVRA